MIKGGASRLSPVPVSAGSRQWADSRQHYPTVKCLWLVLFCYLSEVAVFFLLPLYLSEVTKKKSHRHYVRLTLMCNFEKVLVMIKF